MAFDRTTAITANTTIGTDSDVDTSGAQVIDTIALTDGVVVSAITTRDLAASDIGAQATLTFGIADGAVAKCNDVVADNDYLRIDGTEIEGRSVSEVLSDIGAEAADATIVKTGASSTFTTAQIPSTRVAAFEQPNFGDYQNFVFTLASGTNAFTEPGTEAGNTGQTGVIVLIQPSGGDGVVTWHADYKPVGGAVADLTATNAAVDILPYMIQADNNILIGAPQLDLKATS